MCCFVYYVHRANTLEVSHTPFVFSEKSLGLGSKTLVLILFLQIDIPILPKEKTVYHVGFITWFGHRIGFLGEHLSQT